ncbi:MAG: peptidoglycan editing factor PgeF [Promicromonosporaceae bacterium]|nr:peptidoglycan editing factor PgeF [Promicromonosporaceae bacterium]
MAQNIRNAQAGGRLERIDVDLGARVMASFTTRNGGCSPAPWESLNLGLNVGDDPVLVRRNRSWVETTFDAPIAFATQVHGADVLMLGEAERAAWRAPGAPETAGTADALVATTEYLGLGVLVADCVPVLLADESAGVIAVAHAGREGVRRGVIWRTVEKMLTAGAALTNLRAAVGPAICGSCYEVPQEMQDELAAIVPEAASTTRIGTPALDLPKAALVQLAAAGVIDVEYVAGCTFSDPDFFSHRRATAEGTTTGRQAGIIVFGDN